MQGCCWIEGVRNFVQAYDAGYAFESVVSSEVLLRHGAARILARRLAASGVRHVRVSPEEFRAVSDAEHASGIGAVVRQRWTPMGQARANRGLCWIVLEALRNAGNLGTIIRTAEATGAAGVILVGRACDPYDPAVVRASMGSLFHLALVRTCHAGLERWACAHGVRLVGLAPRAELRWTQLPSDRPVALVLGEERHGLSDRMCALCQTKVQLPIAGRADSLNVAVAAGAMMYELVRRTGLPASSAT